MIDLYYAPTPNGWKISIMLEELGLPYSVIPVNIRSGEQFRPEFLAISPNNRIPAIVDHQPADGGEPFSVFETGAILVYLAEKTGRFLPADPRGRSRTIQWVMWQMSGLGPMLGQHGHFALYTAEKIPYAIERYRDEAARLYGVLDRQLGKTGAFVAGADYSIADIACFPWAVTHKAQGFTLDDYPNARRWYAAVRARPQVQAGLAIGKFVKEPFNEESRRVMFGQMAKDLLGNQKAISDRHSGARRSREPGIHRAASKVVKWIPGLRASHASRNDENREFKRSDKIRLKETPMIEFFFDCSSPWTYLAFHNIQPLAKELGEEIIWRPILVGGIFNTVNPSVYSQREKPVPLKARYMLKDLSDWARSAGLAIKMPPTVFPVNSVKAMRGCIWLGKDMVPFARAVFEAYWGEDKDMSQDAVLAGICNKLGINEQEFFAGISEQAVKDQLKTNTEEVVARGGFGSPTIFVNKTDMYFGNDRLPLIREAVLRRKASAA